jgi:3-hydroxyisobutyrate dehydrogenase-like beta-hydroxyacid dehydrogenase
MAARLAFIGFGEFGQTVALGLRESGAGIAAYDLLFDAGRLLDRAQSLGVRAARDHVAALEGAELVFSAVTAGSSLEAAKSCLPGLVAGQLFLDVNSVSPARKSETAALVAPSGARYVDVAVMGPVAPDRHRVPLLVCGPGAREFLAHAQSLGMRAEFVSEEVGQASAVKMFRSIMVKGLEALMLECMLAANAHGVEERVLASLKQSYPGMDWERLSGYLIERIVSHGRRRAEEMREVAATVRGAGFEPLMASATAARQQWLADLEVKRLLAAKTEAREPLLAAIREALGRADPKSRKVA